MHNSIESLIQSASDRSLPQAVVDAEVAESGRDEEEIRERIRRTLLVMRDAIDEGLKGEVRSPSGMTGGRARRLFEDGPRLLGSRLTVTLARAISTLEVNASMGLIVAAPTAGAAGVLPAILISAGEFLDANEEQLVDGMLVAGGVGGVIAHRASLSGAEGGCQAETGTAAAMGAAAVTWLAGGTHEQIATSVALSLQGMLGLICDPIGGLVEIPCIYRNASAAMQAISAAEMALAGLDFPVSADEVIDVMGEVGRKMPVAYRETALGGLAATPSARRLIQLQPSRQPTGISG
ncbi:MAG TPA: L-serine ammonia-lyase, iron-sulfur-dependent, subunit alpha [Longimicrobiaceae bacterium]|nr:L-serine ammonia-lyase, iron-sulfur-dependent, subunit alpha [Longimicrobiaceae bacterium]